MSRCEVHGDELQPGVAETFDLTGYQCVHPDDAFEMLREACFPNARELVYGWHKEPSPVEFCPSCRDALRAWRTAPPHDWGEKHSLMRIGYDPFRGVGVPAVEASLVTDYVLVEKWLRAVQALGLLAFVGLPQGASSLDEAILAEAAAARRDNAPLDAIRRVKGRWLTAGEESSGAIRLLIGRAH